VIDPICSRVAELEQENARLQALAQKSVSHQGGSRELVSEIEQLRSQLAAAEQRERELNSQLSKRPLNVKTELSEPCLPTSPSWHPAFPIQPRSSDKTSASLSLLVSLALDRSKAAYQPISYYSPPRSCCVLFLRYSPSRLPSPRYLCRVHFLYQTQQSTLL
jgi:hypothetical protein